MHFIDNEPREQHHSRGKKADNYQGMPACLLTEAQPQHQTAEAAREQDGAEGVKALLAAAQPHRLLEEAEGSNNTDDADGQVDEKDPAPREGLGNDTTQCRTGTCTGGNYQSKKTQGPPPFSGREGAR